MEIIRKEDISDVGGNPSQDAAHQDFRSPVKDFKLRRFDCESDVSVRESGQLDTAGGTFLTGEETMAVIWTRVETRTAAEVTRVSHAVAADVRRVERANKARQRDQARRDTVQHRVDHGVWMSQRAATRPIHADREGLPQGYVL